MKKTAFLFILSIFCVSAYPQSATFSKPDYDLIKSETGNKNSAAYYPNLINRYNKNDTTLTANEYKLLYYGFLFQTGYAVYDTNNYDDSIKTILNKNTLSPTDLDLLITYEKKILEKSPFNLRDLNVLAHCYNKEGDTASADLLNFKIRNIALAILSTGDGKTVKTGYHVITISHEYDLLDLLGFDFGGSQSLIGTCDYLTVKDNADGIKGIYFDATKILEAEAKLFEH